MSEPLSTELRQFLQRHIHSVEQLEILRMLAENPSRAWSTGEVYRLIQSTEESIYKNLRYLSNEGFLVFEPLGACRFSPKSPELARQASDLLKTYRERRVTIVEAIYKLPDDPIRHFADAFRLRRDKNDS